MNTIIPVSQLKKQARRDEFSLHLTVHPAKTEVRQKPSLTFTQFLISEPPIYPRTHHQVSFICMSLIHAPYVIRRLSSDCSSIRYPLSSLSLPAVHPSSKALQHWPRALRAYITAFVGPWCLLRAVRQTDSTFPHTAFESKRRVGKTAHAKPQSSPGSRRSLPAGAPVDSR